ncbi:MAG: amidohydrolase family protein, partial [Gemmatimonadaceae bacterium]|nr:amidohydrolase family protein [Gemmatimonadaceae bacterium]
RNTRAAVTDATLAIRNVTVVDVETGVLLADRTVLVDVRRDRIIALDSGSGSPLHRRPTAALAIRNVTVVDVERGSLLRERTVLVRGQRIVSVDSGAAHAIPAGATVVDGAGRSLIPGLWDMHVHTAHPSYFPLLAANGVTGIRDMGGAAEPPTDGCESIRPDSLLAWRARVEAGAWIGPRIVLSGPAASGTGWPTSLPVRTNDEARSAVSALRALGVDFVKVYEGIPLDAYLVLAKAARSAALPIAGHVPVETVGLLDAIVAGQRSIEHVRDALLLCFTDDPEKLARFFAEDRWGEEDIAWGLPVHEQCPQVIEALRTHPVWLTPTLVVERAKVAAEEGAFVDDPRRAYLPASVQEAFAAFVRDKLSQPAAKRASEHLWWRTQQRLVGRMADAGVAILAGTDAACEGGLPGFSLHDELALLVQAGLSPLQALQAATLNSARYVGATDAMGTVAPGELADLVLLDADPLVDIRNTRRIHAVVLNGRLLDRAALDALLEDARRTVEVMR